MPLPFDDPAAADPVIAYTDGGARGNPGPAGFGVRIERPDGTLIEEFSESIGVATNNVAEYRGLIAALEWARSRGVRRVHVRSDSQLLVEQMLGRYKVKSPGLQPLHARAQALAREVGRVTFEHVTRALNAHADRLANKAMDEHDPTASPPTRVPASAERLDSQPEASRAVQSEPPQRPTPALTPFERTVRAFIYRVFAETARAPNLDAIANHAGRDRASVAAALQALAAAHALVLAPASTTIWMAHPFSAVPTAYPVVARGRTYFANCAWDAAGVLAVLGEDGATRTRCADCGTSLSLEARGRQLAGDGVVHFAVPPRRFWENVAFT